MNDMTFGAPMIGEISGGIFDDPDSASGELQCLPKSIARFAGMCCCGNGRPIDRLERNILGIHRAPMAMLW
jgi:hypothetical protein